MNQSIAAPSTGDNNNFLRDTAPAVAYEIASQLYDLYDILERHGWSEDDFRRIGTSDVFRQMVQEAKREWSTTDAETRIRLKAKIATEEGMLPIYSMVDDSDIPPVVRLDAFKTLSRMAGLDAVVRSSTDGGSGKFQIVLNLGGNQPMTIDGKTVEVEDDG